jgi:stearoyl-CoA desaturase (delta-9 desaturase)
LALLQRYFYFINIIHALLLYLCGELLCRLDSSTNGLQFIVWGGILSKVCVWHAVWSANSVCHRQGSRRYKTADNSRNNIIVAILTFGDGWHHNHHYCPYSSRHGFQWWELDINFIVLKLLSRLGVVWDLRVPP